MLDDKYGFRLHVDTAYGGYFALVEDLPASAAAAFEAIAAADSVVVDPHKHGLQPYGCGCVLFRDPSGGRFYRHDSPNHKTTPTNFDTVDFIMFLLVDIHHRLAKGR